MSEEEKSKSFFFSLRNEKVFVVLVSSFFSLPTSICFVFFENVERRRSSCIYDIYIYTLRYIYIYIHIHILIRNKKGNIEVWRIVILLMWWDSLVWLSFVSLFSLFCYLNKWTEEEEEKSSVFNSKLKLISSIHSNNNIERRQ